MFRELSEAGSGMPAEAGHRKRRIWECLFSTNLAPPFLRPPSDRPTACPSRTTVYAYDPPDRIHPADRPSKPPRRTDLHTPDWEMSTERGGLGNRVPCCQ